MKSQAKKLMDFIQDNHFYVPQGDSFFGSRWWDEDFIEMELNKFLKELVDPRLKDAKDEVESLRMELRETRKELEKAQQDIREMEDAAEYASRHDDDDDRMF